MSWQKEIDELAQRVAWAHQMGGADRVARQHAGGRLTVRERIERMLDADSFQEIGAIAGRAAYAPDGSMEGFTPAVCVFGRGRVDGRPVVIAGDDFTVRGGSADAAIGQKLRLSETMANGLRLPLIRLIEGSGGGGSVKTIETTGRANLPGGLDDLSSLDISALNMAQVPVVALGLGSVAGLGAARLVASHYCVMVKPISAVFVAGPPVVERLGEPRTKQELGGWEVQLAAGAVDHAADTEDEAFAAARAASCPICQARSGSCPSGCAAGTIRPGGRRRCSPSSPATSASPTTCAASSRRWWTRTHSSKWAACSAGRSSPGWLGWTAGRSH